MDCVPNLLEWLDCAATGLVADIVGWTVDSSAVNIWVVERDFESVQQSFGLWRKFRACNSHLGC